ncbi:MAG: prevent-host-death family protein [uncultured bacterium]|nr:MAG: prevent-host-death family protein [uncultured bacterium]
MGKYDKILPITDVKKHLLSYVKDLGELNESIAITRNGYPTAVLLSVDEYEGLLETIEILSDAKLMKVINKSRKDMETGRTLSHADVWNDQ